MTRCYGAVAWVISFRLYTRTRERLASVEYCKLSTRTAKTSDGETQYVSVIPSSSCKVAFVLQRSSTIDYLTQRSLSFVPVSSTMPKGKPEEPTLDYRGWSREIPGILNDSKITLMLQVFQELYDSKKNKHDTQKFLSSANQRGRKRWILGIMDDADDRVTASLVRDSSQSFPQNEHNDLRMLLKKMQRSLVGDENQKQREILTRLTDPTVQKKLEGNTLLKEVFQKFLVLTEAVCEAGSKESSQYLLAVSQFAAYFASCLCRIDIAESKYRGLWKKIDGQDTSIGLLKEDAILGIGHLTKKMLRLLLEDSASITSLKQVEIVIDKYSLARKFESKIKDSDAPQDIKDRLLDSFDPSWALAAKLSHGVSLTELVTTFMTEFGNLRLTKDIRGGKEIKLDTEIIAFADFCDFGKASAVVFVNKVLRSLASKQRAITESIKMLEEIRDDVEFLNKLNPQSEIKVHFETLLSSMDLDIESLMSNEASIKFPATPEYLDVNLAVPRSPQAESGSPKTHVVLPEKENLEGKAISTLSSSELFHITHGFFTPESVFRNKVIAALVSSEYKGHDDFLEQDLAGGAAAFYRARSLPPPATYLEKCRSGMWFHGGLFKSLNVLGSGGFATVVELGFDGLRLAGKIQKVPSENIVRHFVRSLTTQSLVHIDFVTPTIGFFVENYDSILATYEDTGELPTEVVIYELMQLGSHSLRVPEKERPKDLLINCHLKSNTPIAFKRILHYEDDIRGVFCALEWLYQKNLIHRDIKPDNILLVQNEPNGPLVVKLCDFGLGKQMTDENTDDDEQNTKEAGTKGFTAPEAAGGNPLTDSDMFSVGYMLLALVTGVLAQGSWIKEDPPTSWFGKEIFKEMGEDHPLPVFLKKLMAPLGEHREWPKKKKYQTKRRLTPSEALEEFDIVVGVCKRELADGANDSK